MARLETAVVIYWSSNHGQKKSSARLVDGSILHWCNRHHPLDHSMSTLSHHAPDHESLPSLV